MGASATELIRRVLSQNPKKTITDPSYTPAAVMLLLYAKDGEYCILLNRRTHQVEHHKGEISFPGGGRDQEDDTLLATALRETHEEMGIRPDHIELLGELDDMPTSSQFLISSFVGTIPYPYRFKPSRIEVAEVLEVPLSTLMDKENVRDEVRIVDERLVYSPSYVHRGHLIYGATARVLQRLLELLDSVSDKEAPWSTKQGSTKQGPP